tara:strand:+ start:62 stop:394 length:333 start_codon:yes stop_codon:yes gene_type:complete
MMNLKIGDRVSFSYLKGAEKSGWYPTLVDYNSRSQNYSGTIEDVRDITENKLSDQTLDYGKIKGERSQNLITVDVDGDGSKAFYHGRMVNVTVEKPEPKSEEIADYKHVG